MLRERQAHWLEARKDPSEDGSQYVSPHMVDEYEIIFREIEIIRQSSIRSAEQKMNIEPND